MRRRRRRRRRRANFPCSTPLGTPVRLWIDWLRLGGAWEGVPLGAPCEQKF
jgi:hypothetical protein